MEETAKSEREIHIKHEAYHGLEPNSIWHLGISSFLHFVYDHHDGKALITKIDCSDGLLMNLDFADQRYVNPLELLISHQTTVV